MPISSTYRSKSDLIFGTLQYFHIRDTNELQNYQIRQKWFYYRQGKNHQL